MLRTYSGSVIEPKNNQKTKTQNGEEIFFFGSGTLQNTYHGAQEGMTKQPSMTPMMFLKNFPVKGPITFPLGQNRVYEESRFPTRGAYQHKSAEIHDKYCFVFSTSITDKRCGQNQGTSRQRKLKGKDKSKNQIKSFQLSPRCWEVGNSCDLYATRDWRGQN